jgi:ribosomal-protein-alanine N-acetyltransferase
MEIRIKEMELKHIDGILVIENESFTEPWPKSLFFQELSSNMGKQFVSVLSNGTSEEVVGYICGWTVLDECTINKIACRGKFRKKGIAGLLLIHFMKELIQKGAKKISLEVRASNTIARLFYKKFSFQQIAIRRGYYNGPKEDAVIMELNIPCELKKI